jgi:hypothetical protein
MFDDGAAGAATVQETVMRLCLNKKNASVVFFLYFRFGLIRKEDKCVRTDGRMSERICCENQEAGSNRVGEWESSVACVEITNQRCAHPVVYLGIRSLDVFKQRNIMPPYLMERCEDIFENGMTMVLFYGTRFLCMPRAMRDGDPEFVDDDRLDERVFT